MKKNILIALFALLAVALNGNAQNNTYNMVIEMANGTKITIGPNDVKNISFNNGELVMTGEDINSLVEQQSKADKRIDSLATVVDDVSRFFVERLDYLSTQMATRDDLSTLDGYMQHEIDDIRTYYAKEQDFKDFASMTKDFFESYAEALNELQTQIKAILETIEELKKKDQ